MPTSREHEPWSLAERVAYIEGRLSMTWRYRPTGPSYDAVSHGSRDDWRSRAAWMRGRSDALDERIELKFRILLALQVATGVVAVTGILILP